jgi:acetoacetyl-CoA synthetase
MTKEASIPLWTPSQAQVDTSQLVEFLSPHGFGNDYPAAHRWSIENPAEFWREVWDYSGVIGHKGDVVFEPGATLRQSRFFPQGSLNFAENLLRQKDDSPALISAGEGKDTQTMSWAKLNSQVAALSQWLVARGVKPSDRVAAVMPNCPEVIIAMLAASSLGAVFSSCSPDFGEQGILDRFGQIEPKILVVCDGYRYGGKLFDIRKKIAAISDQISSVEQILWLPYMGLGESDTAKPTTAWDEVQSLAIDAPIDFRKFPTSHPLYIMFSSGTTGKPKCIVHSAGGTLLQHLKEHKLHCNIKPKDRVFYFTTCGWMMWNWLVSALASQATLLLYDGSPFHPDGNVLFDFIADQQASFFGVSAKYIDALKKDKIEPGKTHDLGALRTIASTGSPLAPESFGYVYDCIKRDVNLASISGGTDIVSCFVLGLPIAPVWRGEIQCAGLGMASEIWDDDGKRIIDQPGELVCRAPFPSMPIGFWNDPDGEKYRTAYFDRFDNVWCHGDFGIETEHGGFIILGRSDATLNPGGVRIGTAEIYRQVEQIDAVTEAIAVGQTWQDDVRVVLFVTLRQGTELDDNLVHEIRSRIRKGASPRHVPAKVIAVPDIPRTKSGKITELAVRDVIHGRPVKNTQALANPEALEHYRDLEELTS